MNSGDLRHRIIFQQLNDVYNEYGEIEPTQKWVDYKTVWAAINPALGRNYYAAQQTQTEATTKINTRYFSDIKRDMQIEYGDITYEIIDIQDVNMCHEELVIYCKEVTVS